MKCVAIIPSGGSGKRFNSPIPKQYQKVLGKELIIYTLEIFQNCNLIDEIIIPASESYFDLLNQIKVDYDFSKITTITAGGKERQDSVYNGLISVDCEDNDLIVVHDAARPLLSLELLSGAIQSALKHDAVVVAIKARDTLIKGKETVSNYIDRDKIFYAQTPQIFRYNILANSLKKANKENYLGTDESMVVKNAGYEINIFDGDFENFKITTQSDLKLFEKLIS